jgi:subfamily B ATP-binding cassette protein HlyB/CyaB
VDAGTGNPSRQIDTGLLSLLSVANLHRVAGDYWRLIHELGLEQRVSSNDDLIRGAKILGLKGRCITSVDHERLTQIPLPALVRAANRYFILVTRNPSDADGGALRFRLVDPVSKKSRDFLSGELLDGPVDAILIAREPEKRAEDERSFGLNWFLPSIWRYRQHLVHVLLASLFIQIFGLVTPLFFQAVIDKVLDHRSYATLHVLTAGLILIGLFDVILQLMRTYLLSHTTNRIDVELGQRLFAHLLRLPIAYFENRGTGQTVARLHELETVRSFITGQALFSALDLVFGLIYVATMFVYSATLTIVVLISIPIYLAIGYVLRPLLRERIHERFNRSAASQQFLVEAVVGMQTIKASAVEPAMRSQWEERLASYVKSGFETTILGAVGQNAVQYVSKVTGTLILFFGAHSVINGDLSVGALVAFNMISSQAIQPILRLSQFWQDFQQVQISVERLGDVLNSEPEATSGQLGSMGKPEGRITFDNVSFRYRQSESPVLKGISFEVAPGEVIGIVGPSGSGKSTLAKLVQRLYSPETGRVLLDGVDLAQVDPSWLRSNVGIVLQENMLFNRSIHDNIAFANPAMPRSRVVAVARLTGADEFVSRLPNGYDTMIEERGANLSGGQRQRIAIARALATDPPVLILDEATSALDYESERLIRLNMGKIVKGRTVLIVAHRLSTVRNCDRILGIQDGRIVEQGSHDALLAVKGLYARLWAMQGDVAEATA